MSWTECTLGDVIKLQRGHDLPDRVRVDGPVPIVSSSGFTGKHNVAKADPPGVVTGRYGTIGEVFFVDEPYWPLNTALYVVDFKGNDPRFAAYLLRNTLKNYKSEKAAVPGVDRNVLHLLKVRTTKRGQQERVVSILSAYDELIDNNRQRMALLEETARLLYREWFVYFRFPGHEHVKIIDGLHEGWRRETFGEVFQFLNGHAFKSSTYIEAGKFGIVTIKNVHDAKFIQECPSRIDDVPREVNKHCFLESGDVLLSLTGNVGRACLVFGENFLLNQRVAKIVGQPGISPHFTYWTFNNKDVQRMLERLSYGVAQLNLSPVLLAAQPFIRPPRHLIEHFTAYTGPVLRQIITLNLAIKELEKARDLLLPRLMNGEIAV